MPVWQLNIYQNVKDKAPRERGYVRANSKDEVIKIAQDLVTAESPAASVEIIDVVIANANSLPYGKFVLLPD